MDTAILRSRILDLAITGELTHSNTDEWEDVRIGDICKTTSGGTPQSKNQLYYQGGDIPWVQSGELHQKYITDTAKKITQAGYDNSSAKYYPINSVLIALYGATVGEVAISKISLTSNQAICAIFPSEKVYEEYLYYFLKTKKSEYIGLASGGAQPNISQEKVKATSLPLPPLSEQHRIVAKVEELLSEVDKIEQAQADITQAATILRSRVLDSALKGELTHSNTEEWTWDSITNVTDPISSRDSQIKASKIQSTGKYAVVSQGQKLIDGYCDDEDKVITISPVILFGDHTRNVKYIDFPFVVGADGTKLHKCKSIDPKFCYYWILWAADNMTNRGYERHYSLLKQTPLHLPPLPEQHRIVAKIERLFAEIDKLVK